MASLAILASGGLHHLANAQTSSSGQEMVGSVSAPFPWSLLAAVFLYLLPGALLLVAVIAFGRHRRPPKTMPKEKAIQESDALELMSQEAFDALVAKAFRREGYLVVERAGNLSNRGVDLELFMGRDRYLVQSRYWREAKVGVAAVRDLYRVISTERAVGGFVVTSGKFTDEARALALGRSIRLVPADSLRTLLSSGSDMTISPVFSRRRNDPVPPACPKCGKAMMSRESRPGLQSGQIFWGCTSFPACRGSREM